jgi:hypothetical protein
MERPLTFLQPVEALLHLTDQDQYLDQSPAIVSIPPCNLDEACWLAHYTIRQNTYAGTHILHHLLTNPPGKGFHLVPLILYRHALDLGDSIGTLLRFGSANNAVVTVRALFEASIALEFVLEGNTFREDRAACYEAFRSIKRLKNLTELHTLLDQDPTLRHTVSPRQDLSEERKREEERLEGKRFNPYWTRYKKANPKPTNWYGLCSAATNLRQLAGNVGWEAEYVFLYNMISEGAHATDDVMANMTVPSEGLDLSIHQLRGPVEKIKELVGLSANFLIRSHNHLLLTYLNNHDVHQRFTRWYEEEYRYFFMWATCPDPLISDSLTSLHPSCEHLLSDPVVPR